MAVACKTPLIGQVVHPEREIMQKTLLRGETAIYGSQVADSISLTMKAPGKQTRVVRYILGAVSNSVIGKQ